MQAEDILRKLLATAGVEINGSNPWDLQVHNPDLFPRVMTEGTLGLGEAYMDGWWDCERLDEFFAKVVDQDLGEKLALTPALAWTILQATLRTGSCGYWKTARDLDAAQEAKLDLVCRKIGLKANQRIWDIGCGWGAFMGFAAERYDARCVGVTISSEQVAYGRRRYADLPVEFQLKDYRDFVGKADHVVSMGMFEHVGPKNYRRYFETARRTLAEDGLFLLHTIWANERRAAIEPWLDKYIFPNGVLPTVGQIASAVEGLFVIEDVENFGADYDRTLMAWRAKFQSNRTALASKYSERFCRMWDYYLLCCAGGFRSRRISVGQFVLSPAGVRGGWVRPSSVENAIFHR